MDEPRRLAMRRASSRRGHSCPCGRTVYGNGLGHFRVCPVHLEQHGWPLGDAWRQAVLERYRGQGAARVFIETQRRLGRWVLDRRNLGDHTLPEQREFDGLVWRLTTEAHDAFNRPNAGEHP